MKAWNGGRPSYLDHHVAGSGGQRTPCQLIVRPVRFCVLADLGKQVATELVITCMVENAWRGQVIPAKRGGNFLLDYRLNGTVPYEDSGASQPFLRTPAELVVLENIYASTLDSFCLTMRPLEAYLVHVRPEALLTPHTLKLFHDGDYVDYRGGRESAALAYHLTAQVDRVLSACKVSVLPNFGLGHVVGLASTFEAVRPEHSPFASEDELWGYWEEVHKIRLPRTTNCWVNVMFRAGQPVYTYPICCIFGAGGIVPAGRTAPPDHILSSFLSFAEGSVRLPGGATLEFHTEERDAETASLLSAVTSTPSLVPASSLWDDSLLRVATEHLTQETETSVPHPPPRSSSRRSSRRGRRRLQ